jgi:hypothetical protein
MIHHSARQPRRRLLTAAICLLGSLLLAKASPLDAADPAKSERTFTLEEIRAGVKQFEQRITNLSVSCDAEVVNHFRSATGGPVPKGLIEDDAFNLEDRISSRWIVDSTGRIWQKHVSQVTAHRADKTQVEHEEEIEAAFDGIRGKWIQITRKSNGDSVLIRQLDSPQTYATSSPLDVTLRYLGTPIIQILSRADAAIAESKTWEERPIVVVEAAVPKTAASTAEFKMRLWIDPSRGFAVVRRQSVARYAPGRPWHVHLDSASYGLVEASPGIWLPSRVEEKNFSVPRVEQDWLNLVVSDTIRYRDWKVNANVPASKFRIQLAVDSAVDFNLLARPPAKEAK